MHKFGFQKDIKSHKTKNEYVVIAKTFWPRIQLKETQNSIIFNFLI